MYTKKKRNQYTYSFFVILFIAKSNLVVFTLVHSKNLLSNSITYCFLFRTTLLRTYFSKELVQKSGAALDRSPGECQVHFDQKKYKKFTNEKKQMKTLPALPPTTLEQYEHCRTCCANQLFLFRHFTRLSRPVSSKSSSKKENKTQTQRSNSAWRSDSQSPPKDSHPSTSTWTTDRSAPHRPPPANTFTHKKKQKKIVPPSSESNRVATLVVRPSLGGRRVLAPLSSSSSTIKSGRHRTAPPPCM